MSTKSTQRTLLPNPKEGISYIYALLDPDTEQIKYIGKTDTPKSRYSSHLWDKIKTKKATWVYSLRLAGKAPIMEILDEVNSNEWELWEAYYIGLYRGWGFDLKNLGYGGKSNSQLCRVVSGKTRQKISASHLSRSLIERSRTHKIRKQLSLIKKKDKSKKEPRKHSEQAKLKMAERMRNATPEHRFRLSIANSGRRYSDEHKKKLSLAHSHQKNENLRKEVYQLDKLGNVIKKHISVSEAARELFNDARKNNNICAAIRKKQRCGGYFWTYNPQGQIAIDNNKAENEMHIKNMEQSHEINMLGTDNVVVK